MQVLQKHYRNASGEIPEDVVKEERLLLLSAFSMPSLGLDSGRESGLVSLYAKQVGF